MGEKRRQKIIEIIETELRASGGAVDPAALAAAIDEGLDAAPSQSGGAGAYAAADESTTPDELNASNDE